MRPSVEVIQRITADAFGLPQDAMWSQQRSRRIARPRQVAMYLSRDMTARSLPEIGRLFGGRDHTTVLHACRQIEKLIQQDNIFACEVGVIRGRLLATMPRANAFNLLSLGDWIALARKVNVPVVAAHLVAEILIRDMRDDEDRNDPVEHRTRLAAFYKSVTQNMRPAELLCWDHCQSRGVTLGAVRGLTTVPPTHMISHDEERVISRLDTLPPGQDTLKVWRRPWVVARMERAVAVEYRAFILNGEVAGISNRHPHRVLPLNEQTQYEIKLITVFAKAMIAGQTAPIINPQLEAAGLDPARMHGSLDFIVTARGPLLLGGGPPYTPNWGADPLCFRHRPVNGVAFGTYPEAAE